MGYNERNKIMQTLRQNVRGGAYSKRYSAERGFTNPIVALLAGIAAVFGGIFSGYVAPTQLSPASQSAVASVAISSNGSATSGESTPGSTPSTATTTIVNQYITQPVIERTVQTVTVQTDGYVTENELSQRLTALSDAFARTMLGTTYPAPATSYASDGVWNSIALMGRIENLSGTNLSDITVHGVSGLTAGDIPSLPYLSTSGGTLTGDVSLTNATSTNFFATLGHFTNGIIDTLTSTAATITNLIATTITGTNATFANATTTNATSTNLYASTLNLGTGLSVANGGLGTTTWVTNSIPYFNGTYFTANNTNLNFNGTTLTASNLASGGTLGVTGVSTLGGFLSTASSTVTSGLFSMNGGASTTNITASGTGYFGNVGVGTTTPFTKLAVVGNVYLGSGLSSTGSVVSAAPYATVASGSTNFGPSSGETSLEFIDFGHILRIRENGAVSRIKIFIPSMTGVTGFYFKVWRASGSNFDLVGSSTNLASGLVAGQVNTITLPTNITVNEGDYVGARVEYSSASAQNFYAAPIANTTLGELGSVLYYVTNATPSTAAYNWTAQSSVNSEAVLIEADMTAPIFVTIGDSITSGLTGTGSFADNYQLSTNVASSYAFKLGHALGYTYQNMGIGGQVTSQMSARFAADVVNLNPKFVVIMGGVNDILGGTPNSSIIANITSMLDQAHTAGIIPVVIGVMPFRGYSLATNAMLQQRDLLNASLRTLVTNATYNGHYVDTDPYVGQYYAGGDPNNKWQLQPIYDKGDHIHPNSAGQARIAQVVSDAINQVNVQSAATFGNLTLNGDASFAGDTPRFLGLNRNALYNSSGSDLTISAGGASVGSVDQSGGNLIFQSGVSTGVGASSILFYNTVAGTTGATDTPMTLALALAGGNVGLGNSNPTALLTVGAANSNSNGGINNFEFGYNYAKTDVSLRRVGTLVQSNDVTAPFILYASAVGSTTSSGRTAILQTGEEAISNSGVLALQSAGGTLGIGTNTPAGKLDVEGTGGIILNAGNVGVGTTTPLNRLTVVGTNSGSYPGSTATFSTNLGTANTIGNQINITNSAMSWGLLAGFDGPGVSTSTYHGANSAYLINIAAGPLNFGTSNQTYMTIDSAGKVGIGTAAPASAYILDVNGAVHSSSYMVAALGFYPVSSNNGMNNVLGGNKLSFRTNSIDNRVVIDSTGNVGIGTTTPWAQLSIAALSNNTAPLFTISTSTANATSTAFIVDQNGKVGIATSSPWRTLSVTGTVGFDGLTGSTGAGSLCLDSNKQVVYNSGSDACLSSTRATKHDIQNLNLDTLTLVKSLQPVSFVYNNDASSTVRYGFIAEDTAAVDTHLATHDANGNISGIDDRSIIAIVVEAIRHFAETFTTKELTFTRASGDELTVKKLCVDDVCVMRDQFLRMVEQGGQAPAPSSPTPSEPDEPQVDDAPLSPSEQPTPTDEAVEAENRPEVSDAPPLAPEELPAEIPAELPTAVTAEE